MKRKLIFSLVIFCVSLFITFIWMVKAFTFDWSEFLKVNSTVLLIGFALTVALYVFDLIRYKVILNTFNYHSNFFVLLEASIINFFFAWTTPGAIFAAPMTSYFLMKRGCTLEISLVSAFGKSILGLIQLLAITICFFYISGAFRKFESSVVITIVISFVNYLLLAVMVVITAFYGKKIKKIPIWFNRIVTKLEPLFVNMTSKEFFRIMLAQFIYYLIIIALGMMIINEYLPNSDLLLSFSLSSLFLSLIYLSPTPGGIGLGEAVGIPVLGMFMNINSALVVTLLIRIFIVYLPIAIGGIYLGFYYLNKILSD